MASSKFGLPNLGEFTISFHIVQFYMTNARNKNPSYTHHLFYKTVNLKQKVFSSFIMSKVKYVFPTNAKRDQIKTLVSFSDQNTLQI